MARVGGIAGENIGQIADCYVVWNRSYSGGDKHLVEENKGQLKTSVLIEKGTCSEIIDAAGRKKVNFLPESEKDIYNLGFSQDKWEYTKNKNIVRFATKNWYCRFSSAKKMQILHIKSTDQYIKLAAEINKGNSNYCQAHILLDCDINFKGKSIPVIAANKANPFCGVFDGQGHMIWNGIINDKEANYSALFGYNQGTIINVTFDGRVISEKNAAGFCGVNRGTIDSCAALVRVDTKGDSASGAGIALVNEGMIANSYVVFEPRKGLPAWLIIAAAVVLFVFIGCLGFATISVAMDVDREYVAVETDDFQTKSHEESDGIKNNSHTLSVSLMENITISRSQGLVGLSFSNPAGNVNKLVAELLIEDAEGNRTVVARSGAVLPGYEISQMTLTDEASILTGSETEGIIQLVPYDEKTESRGMVQVELPVNITYVD